MEELLLFAALEGQTYERNDVRSSVHVHLRLKIQDDNGL